MPTANMLSLTENLVRTNHLDGFSLRLNNQEVKLHELLLGPATTRIEGGRIVAAKAQEVWLVALES